MGCYIKPVGLSLEALLTYQGLVPLKGLSQLVMSHLILYSWRPLIPGMQQYQWLNYIIALFFINGLAFDHDPLPM